VLSLRRSQRRNPDVDSQPFNFDVQPTSKLRTNVWLFVILLSGSVTVYALWRDLAEADRDIESRDIQQEKHFVHSDARISELERRQTTVERQLDKIAAGVDYLRTREEYQQRREQRLSNPQ
jgi:hypothetical protein